ncbi:uncharacterized protein LOC115994806 [Quercus lobata]|uniref:Uncharacterized protein n=1 Tax=Quercus lobata TaxID=97700 RepID=A0A7N2M0N8_QUELO|nr:uncharacterized protein LOC115994806 [Quercus lobata]
MASPTPQKLEELLLDLIEKVEDPVVKVQYLTKFQKILVRETEEPKPKSFKSQVNLQEILNRFTKVEKEVTVSDLQHEIKEIKSEVRTLKEEVRKLGQALTILRIDHNFLDQKMKHQDNTSHQGNDEAGPSYQNPLDDEEVENIFDESANLSLQTKDKTARIHDQLFNLKCPTLSDFRWYKDVFITRVMLRDDCNSPLWKEKFINGLPSLFAYKILLTLSSPSGVIDYDNLTYGDISTVIHRECQKMCNDIEISRKAKYDASSFCTQYDLPPIAPSKRKSRRRPKQHF